MKAPRLETALLAVLVGCAHAGALPGAGQSGNLHAQGTTGRVDPTVRGARIVPEVIEDKDVVGMEAGGGVRAVVAGLRVVSMPNGAVLAAEDRLPPNGPIVTALPERVGGGFLFVAGASGGSVVWRADRWLAPARPIFTSGLPVAKLVIGLDRVYLRANDGSHQAIDARTGARLDLGPWPGSSFVGSYAASDGWRAVAVNDLRGAVATFDAGATWRPLGLPIDPKELVPSAEGESILVRGNDALRQSVCFEVRADGQVNRLSACPPGPGAGTERPSASAATLATRTFGGRPLLAAIEDGWPLADGTAVVARDGALARIRIADGALVDFALDAYPLKPSRCHPVPLARPSAPGDFGFVCGEPHGRTVLYRYDAPVGRMVELRRFAEPRALIASGNGAITVRGPCGAESGDAARTQQTYCLLPRDDRWRELHVEGGSDERIVGLTDGRVALLSSPHGELSTAHLTVLDHDRATTVPIAFPALTPEAARTLKLGMWLDGFEERRPGVLGGWVEISSTMMGLEVDLSGHAHVGAFVRDLGSPMVSGRYGLGWAASRRGYETVDGGMTWQAIEVPEPIGGGVVRSRACGPIGCSAAGWLRVGWGAPEPPPPLDLPPPQRRIGRPRHEIELSCEPGEPPQPPPKERVARVSESESTSPRGVFRTAALGTAELSPFLGVAPPPLHADEIGLQVEALDVVDRFQRSTVPVAHVYAWGPRSGDWSSAGRWTVRWLSPFGGWQEMRQTQMAAAPFGGLDTARHMLGQGAGVPLATWVAAFGDDPTHALLVGRRPSAREATVLALEADHPIAEIHRADGEPFAEIDTALRAAGRWYLATASPGSELPAAIVWQVDGVTAHELTRVPRVAVELRAGEGRSVPRLARRSDGRAIGLVVDGQPTADNASGQRWLLPLDPETGAAGDPESLGAVDLSDRDSVPICAEDEPVGWTVDAAWVAGARIDAGDGGGALTNLFARLRLSRNRSCLERLSGTLMSELPAGHPAGPRLRTDTASVYVSVFAPAPPRRRSLRCIRK